MPPPILLKLLNPVVKMQTAQPRAPQEGQPSWVGAGAPAVVGAGAAEHHKNLHMFLSESGGGTSAWNPHGSPIPCLFCPADPACLCHVHSVTNIARRQVRELPRNLRPTTKPTAWPSPSTSRPRRPYQTSLCASQLPVLLMLLTILGSWEASEATPHHMVN